MIETISMRSARIIFFFPLFLQASSISDMDSKEFSSTIANFAVKFCNEAKQDKSMVSSPLSAEFVLALLTLGATEPAHSELLTALGLPDDDAIRSSFGAMSSQLRSLKGVTLDVANRVYVKQGPHALNAKLQEDAVKVFDAGIEKIDFSKSADAANQINQWVESKTNHKIKDLLSSDSLNNDTRLVLVNALYFKGNWQTKFDPNHTMDQPFHVNIKTTIQIPMMFKEAEYRYGVSDKLGAQMLELPYKGGESSMIIVLPDEIEGLNGVMQKLAGGHDLIADFENMNSMKVQVTLPKFKIETELDLIEILPKLGIKAIFGGSGPTGLDNLLDPPEPLVVSKAVQKAFIEVNEEGAEAAAATGMVVMLRCARPPPPRFTVEHPFLFILTGGPNRNTLFTGVFRGPA